MTGRPAKSLNLSHDYVYGLLFSICHDDRHMDLHVRLKSREDYENAIQEMDPHKDGSIDFDGFAKFYETHVAMLQGLVVSHGSPLDVVIHFVKGHQAGKDYHFCLPENGNLVIDVGGTPQPAAETGAAAHKHLPIREGPETVQAYCKLKCSGPDHAITLHSGNNCINNGESNPCKVTLDGAPVGEGQQKSVTPAQMICIGNVAFLASIAVKGAYHPTHHNSSPDDAQPLASHNASKKDTANEEAKQIARRVSSVQHQVARRLSIQTKSQALPSRAEVHSIYEAVKTGQKNRYGLTLPLFTLVVKRNPKIFGHMWTKAKLAHAHAELEDRARRDAGHSVLLSQENHFDEDGLESQLKYDQHFRHAFAEFAFRYALQRAHTKRRLDWARRRHLARVNVDVSLHENVKETESDRKISDVDKFVASSITLVYLLYPTMCSSSFSLVACQPVGKMRTFLQRDLEIECYGPNHMPWFVLLALPALLGYVLGLPLIAFILLKKNKHRLHFRHERFRYGILCIGYKDETYYWEVWVAVRKAVISGISVFLLTKDVQTQALTAECFVVLVLVAHTHFRPYIPVTINHNTLFNAETSALVTAHLTLVAGMLMFEKLGGQQSQATSSFQDDADFEWFIHMLTSLIVFLNFVFIGIAMWWWLVLKLMDLENALEHADENKTCTVRVILLLQRCLPDWETQSQALEVKQAQDESADDLRNVDFQRLHRVQKLAHGFVQRFRKRHNLKVAPEQDVLEAAEKVETRIFHAEQAFQEHLKSRAAQAKARLDARRRRRESCARQQTAMVKFTVPKGLSLAAIGFKIKLSKKIGELVVYGLDFDSPACRSGVKNGMILRYVGAVPAVPQNIATQLSKAPRPLILSLVEVQGKNGPKRSS